MQHPDIQRALSSIELLDYARMQSLPQLIKHAKKIGASDADILKTIRFLLVRKPDIIDELADLDFMKFKLDKEQSILMKRHCNQFKLRQGTGTLTAASAFLDLTYSERYPSLFNFGVTLRSLWIKSAESDAHCAAKILAKPYLEKKICLS